jgi:hypothetical protein
MCSQVRASRVAQEQPKRDALAEPERKQHTTAKPPPASVLTNLTNSISVACQLTLRLLRVTASSRPNRLRHTASTPALPNACRI